MFKGFSILDNWNTDRFHVTIQTVLFQTPVIDIDRILAITQVKQ